MMAEHITLLNVGLNVKRTTVNRKLKNEQLKILG